MPQLVLSPENPNRPSEIDAHFAEDGGWEKNKGRIIGRRMTKCFVKHVQIPLNGQFSLLDVGCALGDSMPVLHSAYPQAKLVGCDVSANAVRRCTAEYGHYATFFESSIHELSRQFDVIFCSNLIEHIEKYVEMVAHLTSLAKIVYVMVPYMELHKGERLSPKLGMWHVATFEGNTFDLLKKNGLEIRTWIFRCPGAWGRALWRIPIAKARAYVLNLDYEDRKQIVFELRRKS